MWSMNGLPMFLYSYFSLSFTMFTCCNNVMVMVVTVALENGLVGTCSESNVVFLENIQSSIDCPADIYTNSLTASKLAQEHKLKLVTQNYLHDVENQTTWCGTMCQAVLASQIS